MSKMPEPVAFLVDWPDEPDLGHYFAEEQATIGRSQPLITTTQAEAYADAKAKEALEAAAKICDDRAMKNEAAVSADEPDEASSLRAAAWQMGVCARDIRVLIPLTKNEAEE